MKKHMMLRLLSGALVISLAFLGAACATNGGEDATTTEEVGTALPDTTEDGGAVSDSTDTTADPADTTADPTDTTADLTDTTEDLADTTADPADTTADLTDTTAPDEEGTTVTPTTGRIVFLTLAVEGRTVRGTVANGMTSFSFLDEVECEGSASYSVSYDVGGRDPIPTKTAALEVGDNTFYILERVGDRLTLYTVTIRRLPTYTVTFDPQNGDAAVTVNVEEGATVTLPTPPTREGYTFTGWQGDTDAPVTEDVTFCAVWEEKTYTVTFEDYDGRVLSEVTVTHGADAALPTSPLRAGYRHTGWSGSCEDVTEDVTVTAVYEIVKNQVFVTLNTEGDVTVARFTLCGEVRASALELTVAVAPNGTELVSYEAAEVGMSAIHYADGSLIFSLVTSEDLTEETLLFTVRFRGASADGIGFALTDSLLSYGDLSEVSGVTLAGAGCQGDAAEN